MFQPIGILNLKAKCQLFQRANSNPQPSGLSIFREIFQVIKHHLKYKAFFFYQFISMPVLCAISLHRTSERYRSLLIVKEAHCDHKMKRKEILCKHMYSHSSSTASFLFENSCQIPQSPVINPMSTLKIHIWMCYTN